MKPKRIQLRRTKGFNLQAASMALNGLPAVNVARPSKWGNPWKVRKGPLKKLTDDASQAEAVEAFTMMVDEGNTPPFALATIRTELRGKNLACWCKGTPCHAEILLAISNA